jgi:hypothetical protein
MAQQPEATAIVEALTREGFAEFKREVTQGAHGAVPAGGLWQGLDARTGAVASVIWATTATDDASVFLDIDGAPARSTVDLLAHLAHDRRVRMCGDPRLLPRAA